MKLAQTGTVMLTVSTCLLLMSCKQKSGLEQLSASFESIKGIKATYVVQRTGKADLEVKSIISAPGRVKMEGKGFEVVCNEREGYYESVFDRKVYDLQPNFRHIAPGTGTIVDSEWVSSGPGIGIGPQRLGEGKWKREPDINGNEKYSQDWESMSGKMHIELVVSRDGQLISYLAPTKTLYTFKSLEFVNEVPISEFKIEPREGFVCYRIDGKLPRFETGMPLPKEIFTKGAEKIEAHSFIAVYDPEVYDATALKKWFNAFTPMARRLIATRGNGSEEMAVDAQMFDTGFTSSPTLILTNEKGLIVGLWMGFDPANTREMELEIRQLLFEHT